MQMEPRFLLSNWKHTGQFLAPFVNDPPTAAHSHVRRHTHLPDILMSFEQGNCPGRHLNMEEFQLLLVWLQAKYGSQRIISRD